MLLCWKHSTFFLLLHFNFGTVLFLCDVVWFAWQRRKGGILINKLDTSFWIVGIKCHARKEDKSGAVAETAHRRQTSVAEMLGTTYICLEYSTVHVIYTHKISRRVFASETVRILTAHSLLQLRRVCRSILLITDGTLKTDTFRDRWHYHMKLTTTALYPLQLSTNWPAHPSDLSMD